MRILDFRAGYKNGVLRAINDVWHDASIQPETGLIIVLSGSLSTCEVYHTEGDIKDWIAFTHSHPRGIILWAYKIDLLPDVEELPF